LIPWQKSSAQEQVVAAEADEAHLTVLGLGTISPPKLGSRLIPLLKISAGEYFVVAEGLVDGWTADGPFLKVWSMLR
jgi:hypothetical protein